MTRPPDGNAAPASTGQRPPVERQETPSVRRSGLGGLLIFTLALHLPSLWGPFFIDDYVYLSTARSLQWPGLTRLFTSPTMDESASSVWWVPEGTLPFYRPVGQLSFAVDHFIWGMWPAGYHLTNLVLHLVCTILMWRLARYGPNAAAAPLAAATVFAVHPVHIEAVAWISSRFDLLVCTATLGSVLCCLRWIRTEARVRWLVAGWFLFATGLGCKETALVMPVAILGIELLLRRPPSSKTRWRRLTAAMAGLLLIAGLYLVGRVAMFGGLGDLPPPYGIDRSDPVSALNGVAANTALYLLDLALCIPVDAFYIAQYWWTHPVALAAATTLSLALLFASLRLAGVQRTRYAGLMWLLLFTAPALLAMPGERNIYLATVGFALFMGAVYDAGCARWASPRAVRIVGRLLVCMWAVVGIAQQRVMLGLAEAGDKVYQDLERLLPDPVPGARICVVNQSPLNTIGFEQAIRLRYGRDDLTAVALTVAPRLNPTCRDTIEQTSSHTIRITRSGAWFLDSFVEQFHLFGSPVTLLAHAARRFGWELIHPPASYENLTVLEFRLPQPIGDPRLRIFIWDNRAIRDHFDFAAMTRRAHLVPWPGEKESG